CSNRCGACKIKAVSKGIKVDSRKSQRKYQKEECTSTDRFLRDRSRTTRGDDSPGSRISRSPNGPRSSDSAHAQDEDCGAVTASAHRTPPPLSSAGSRCANPGLASSRLLDASYNAPHEQSHAIHAKARHWTIRHAGESRFSSGECFGRGLKK